MKRHESWRYWYGQNRYLRHLDVEELHQRGRDTMNVNLTLTDAGLIGMLDIKEIGSEPIEKFTHYLEECALRQLPMTMGDNPDALKSTIPDFTSELAGRAARAMSAHPEIRSGHLFKFGKERFLRPLLETGKLRIQTASSFTDPRHNQAVSDNEMSRSFKMAIPRAELIEILSRRGVPNSASVRQDFIEFSIDFYTDYWVTCFARRFAPRMAVDFDADALVVVKNLPEFQSRLKKAFRKNPPYRAMHEGNVAYFDPCLPNCDVRKVPLIKPFKYYYQHEYRFFWFPKKPTATLDYEEVEMGNIADICELITW